VPQDLGKSDRADNLDDAYVLAEMIAISECTVSNWTRMGVVSYADGAYLELHARQIGLFKQGGESDGALRARIQTPPLAITPDLIISAMQQIVDDNGGGQAIMVELPRDSIYASRQMFADHGRRVGTNMVIVLIPASANCLKACTDALRAKRAAGKNYLVQEYTQ